MTIRPEIQAILDRTAITVPSVNKTSLSPALNPRAVGDLQGPREFHFSSYLVSSTRPWLSRQEDYRLEIFNGQTMPTDWEALDNMIVIWHNHASSRPCFTNDGCRRMR